MAKGKKKTQAKRKVPEATGARRSSPEPYRSAREIMGSYYGDLPVKRRPK